METNRILRGLDPQQRAAVSTDASPLVIIAAAGSGKTTVLTRRIARRIADGTAEASHVLAVTFTREAAGELRRRVRRLDVREDIETGTFHAIALRLLSDRALAEGRAAPAIAPDRIRLMREVLTETRRRVEPAAALSDIDWARARLVDPARFTEATRAVRRRAQLDAESFVDVWTRFHALKRQRGVVDFDDLLVEALELIRRDATFASVVRWRFRHLFIDEAQDLNPLQYELLEAIRGGRPDICLVGDPRQAIYGWNGADPTLLGRIEERLPGVTVVSLTGNHRCSPQIVRTGAAALANGGTVDDTESRRPDGNPVCFVTCADEHDEAAAVASRVRTLIGRYGAREVAVLARTNDQLVGLQRALRASRVVAEIASARPVARTPLQRVFDEVMRITSREGLAAWAEGVWTGSTGFDSASPDSRADTGPSDSADVRRRVAEELDRFLSSGAVGTFRAWIDARHPFDDLEAQVDGEDEPAVTLATFHAAKGREWQGVVVTGVEEGLVPHGSATTEAQRLEESRLLYVAITRAGTDLTVTSTASRKGRAVAESPWLTSLRTAAAQQETRIAPPPSVAIPLPPDPLADLRSWRAGLARAAGIAERAVCTDQTLRSLVEMPPEDPRELATRLGISVSAAERLAPRLLGLLTSPASA